MRKLVSGLKERIAMRRRNRRVAALVAIALLFSGLVAAPGAVAAKPDVVVNGGGQADYDDMDGGTNFAIGARISSDGSASGHFNCVIPGVVTISGHIDEGWDNNDGSVTFSGVATLQDKSGGTPPFILIKGEPFTVTLWEGGPGEGQFRYIDTVVDDAETVTKGRIAISGA